MSLARVRRGVVVRLLAGLLMLASWAGGGAVAGSGAKLTNEEIVRGFDKVAFGLEEGEWARPGITKWRRPILIAVGGEGFEPYLDFIQAKTEELSWVTRHEIRQVPYAEANTLMVFTRSVVDDVATRHRQLFGQLFDQDPARIDAKAAALRASRTLCYFGSAVGAQDANGGGYEIEFARIFISTNIPREHLLHCVLEEMAQMMGLFNDSVSLRQSIFNDQNNFQVALPEHDMMLLRVLYDHRIRPGMTRDQALPIARQILEEVRPNDSLPWTWR